METQKKNIFVLGMDEENAEKLNQVPGSENLIFHQLLSYDYIHDFEHTPMDEIMESARQQLKGFDGSIDGMLWLFDFPGVLMGPILCKEFGIQTAEPLSVFKAENKYLSRVEQQKVIPECTPKFFGFNPGDPESIKKIDLEYPFWIKPAISFSGHLGFEIKSDQDLGHAVDQIQHRKDLFADPYFTLEKQIEMSEDMHHASEKIFVAEQIISGKQCTLEGYIYNGEFDFHGLIDSFRYPNRMSFSRYQYPSKIPQRVQKQMHEKAEKILRRMGYENASFNIEFFWDRKNEELWLLEINTRISQSHCNLFKMVDGVLSHKIPIDLALGRRPELPHRKGEYKLAAKLFLRSFIAGKVTRSPSKEQIREIEKEFDAEITHTVTEGMQLEDLKWQDSYSYVLTILYLGAQSQKELLDKFDIIANKLDIEVEGKKIRSKQGRRM
ncbi:acetyl-CoA carboxylase biotin carboxylase subunit [Anaerohalosphaera lusitana]|uniref:Acetyl-CoA carboxylase biotin carboxylase subunit n=1 Tax=Anaerohalosphaera lusitana TaxID=1936003 RepID=A0A1U9NKV2_9BACT|nr:ATP-grasp domain-containing protein [Anaerohalosphaera lusitana]AQT68220.1 acetyl-CoA carboxylase biotin carboxylase subunit [Anaerohalosphaera lusitana]